MRDLYELIKENVNNPEELENLYDNYKTNFENAFDTVFMEHPDNYILKTWNARLNKKQKEKVSNEKISNAKKETVLVLLITFACAVLTKALFYAGLQAKIIHYSFSAINFVVPYFIGAWFLFYFKFKPDTKTTLISASGVLLTLIIVNVYTGIFNRHGDIYILMVLHVPVILWFFIAMVYSNETWLSHEKISSFIKLNVESVLYFTVISIIGIIITGIATALFIFIGVPLTYFIYNWFIYLAFPLAIFVSVSFALLRKQKDFIAPKIASVFSVFILLVLIAYLIFIIIQGQNPYKDRSALLVFNLVKLGVIAICIFTVTEKKTDSEASFFFDIINSALIFIVIIIDLIIFAAIIMRITEYGFTPNRTTVLGLSIITLTHLVLTGIQFVKYYLNKTDYENVKKKLINFIPVYGLWAFTVAVIFPIIFGFG